MNSKLAILISLLTTFQFACVDDLVDPDITFGNGDPSGEGAIDGARLHKRHMIASDGSVETVNGWTDTDQNTTCSFRLASDGFQRCLPVAALAAYFLDASCTERVIYAYEPLCGDPTWGSWVDVPGAECFEGGEHVAKVLAREQTAQVFYKDPLGGCSSSQVTAGFVVFKLAPEEPAQAFVEATIE